MFRLPDKNHATRLTYTVRAVMADGVQRATVTGMTGTGVRNIAFFSDRFCTGFARYVCRFEEKNLTLLVKLTHLCAIVRVLRIYVVTD